MFKRLMMISAAVALTLACDMHDHESGASMMKGVTIPAHTKDECLIACHKNQGEEIVVAGYIVTKGSYQDGHCVPTDYTEHVAETDSPYIARCNAMTNCKDSQECWPDSDTSAK